VQQTERKCRERARSGCTRCAVLTRSQIRQDHCHGYTGVALPMSGLDDGLELRLQELAHTEQRTDLVSCCLAYTRPPAGLGWLVIWAVLLETSALPRTHTVETLRACLLVRRADGMVEQRPLVELTRNGIVSLDPIVTVPTSSLMLGRRGVFVTRVHWGLESGWVPNRALRSWTRLTA
jgi:hypothetical protein